MLIGPQRSLPREKVKCHGTSGLQVGTRHKGSATAVLNIPPGRLVANLHRKCVGGSGVVCNSHRSRMP